MDINLQDILLRVGEKGTPLKKLSKEQKKELKTLLMEFGDSRSSIPNELLLRAYISTNEPINIEMKSVIIISSALNLKDTLKYANKLSRKEEIVDAADFFKSLIAGVKNSRSINTVKSVVNCIKKWQKWVDTFYGRPTNKTEESLIAIIKELALIIPRPENIDNKIVDKYKKLIFPMCEIILNIASKSKSCDTYVASLKTVNAIAEKFPSLIINDIFSDDKLYKNIELLKENILRQSEYHFLNGDAEKVRELYGAVTNIWETKTILSEYLQKLWEIRGATLNEDVQSVIKNILFDEPVLQNKFELSSKELGSNIRHLATALMSSWESRKDGPRAKDSFELLASVLKKYFNLTLGGNVGETGKFRRTAHESIDDIILSENAMIEVMRPWVEWDGPHKKEIIIKSLVKPAAIIT